MTKVSGRQVPGSVPGSSRKPGTANEIIARLKQATGSHTHTELGACLKISQASVSKAIAKNEIPPAWLVAIGSDFGASIDWLLYGEGDSRAALKADRDDLLGQLIDKTWEPERDFLVQVVGLADSGIDGWELLERTRMYAVAPIDICKAGGFAVAAVGTALKPTGVEPGFTLFCDPSVAPRKGNLVFVEDSEGHATVKVLSGESQTEGAESYILQGWLPQNPQSPDKPQKAFTLEVKKSEVKQIAVVVYIKRGV